MNIVERTKVYSAHEALTRELDSLRYLLSAAQGVSDERRDAIILNYNRAIQRLESCIMALDVIVASWNEEVKQ
jgi:hypothetical protein